MILHTTDIDKYFDSLDDVRPEYTPVKCTSLVQYFKLEGKKSIITKDNLVPITFLQYVYFSPAENRYYYRAFPNYSCDHLYFYKKLIPFEDNILIEQLRDRVLNGHGVWLLFNKQQILDMNAMLVRVWGANRSDKGKLKYQDWITLAELTLKLNDFKEYQSGVTGYKTVINQFETKIIEFWKNVVSNNK